MLCFNWIILVDTIKDEIKGQLSVMRMENQLKLMSKNHLRAQRQP